MPDWEKRFPTPVPLPNGGEMLTLSDARSHILALPASEQAEVRWQTAAGELLKAADPPGRGPWIDFARIAMMQALYPKQPAPGQRRDKRAKRYRILR